MMNSYLIDDKDYLKRHAQVVSQLRTYALAPPSAWGLAFDTMQGG
jgi:hypothetical protein